MADESQSRSDTETDAFHSWLDLNWPMWKQHRGTAPYYAKRDAFMAGRASVSEQLALDQTELQLLIDYHDNQDAGAEAMDMPEACAYHMNRSAQFADMKNELLRREQATLDRMLKPRPAEREGNTK